MKEQRSVKSFYLNDEIFERVKVYAKYKLDSNISIVFDDLLLQYYNEHHESIDEVWAKFLVLKNN